MDAHKQMARLPLMTIEGCCEQTKYCSIGKLSKYNHILNILSRKSRENLVGHGSLTPLTLSPMERHGSI